jgi:hypothetical protein
MHASHIEHNPMSTTTIRIDVETRDELLTRGRMGESYDDVIRRLLTATKAKEGVPPEQLRRTVAISPKPLFTHQNRE